LEKPAFDHFRSFFFDKLSETWDSLGPLPSDDKIVNFLNRLNIESEDTVVDLGTGTGLLIPYIFRYQPKQVIAIDLSEKMLMKVEEKYKAKFGERLILLQADIHNSNLPSQSVHVVICNGAYPHFHDKELALAEINRILQPGGVLAINHFSSKDRINSIHAASSNEYIQRDLLGDVEQEAAKVKRAGFIVKTTIDNESEYCLVAGKP